MIWYSGRSEGGGDRDGDRETGMDIARYGVLALMRV
jgi:hypothetical protein